MTALERQPFDLVITDIDMGHMNGLDLLRHVRAQAPGLPVIVVSGHHDGRALELGATEHLVKPVGGQQVLGATCRAARAGARAEEGREAGPLTENRPSGQPARAAAPGYCATG